MTNVCNIFKPLTNENGNFLLFSSYIKDLSQYAVDSGHKVSPSKFICMNLGYDELQEACNNTPIIGYSVDSNSYLPGYFQNVLENGAARAYFDNDSFSCNFWYLISNICLNETKTSVADKIVYVGDIDTASWEDGYFDTILNINSGATKQAYEFQEGVSSTQGTAPTPMEVLQFLGSEFNYNIGTSISGYGAEAADLPIPGYELTNISMPYVDADNDDPAFERLFKLKTSQPSGSFTFNTIVILYDILDESGHATKEGIPMGVYFTGNTDTTSETLINPVTIYPSDPDAYGVGTSWSLRIASRFSVDPTGAVKVSDIELESGAIYDSISAQLNAVADLLKTVQDSFKETNKINVNLKNTLIQFFNTQRVNIPYIKDGYWFVNGVSTGYPAYQPLPSNWFEAYQATDAETEEVFE